MKKTQKKQEEAHFGEPLLASQQSRLCRVLRAIIGRSLLVFLLPTGRAEHSHHAAQEAADHAGDHADLGHLRSEHCVAEDGEEEDAGEQSAHESEHATTGTAEVAILVGGSILAAEEIEGRPVADPEGGQASDDADQESAGLDHDVGLFL